MQSAEAAHAVGHVHDPELEHHFHDLGQQRQSSLFGMWVFLVQEIMFFGGLFTAYAVYRWVYPEAWDVASGTLSEDIGFMNTAVLLGSSYTMALAVRAGQLGKKNAVVGWIVATIILGSVFLGVKWVYEYSHKYELGVVPGFYWEPGVPLHEGHHAGPELAKDIEKYGKLAKVKGTNFFMGLYFVMTGMHALHMVIGIFLFIWVIIAALKGKITAKRHALVENMGLYWHFVDIVWIFLFPLLYLLGKHKAG